MSVATDVSKTWTVQPKDRLVLRDLASRVAEIAAQPAMAERRAIWRRHNSLERVRPMILIFPEGAWRELIPQDTLSCEDETARSMEFELRRRIYTHEHFHDDTVIEDQWVVNSTVIDSGWGVETRHRASAQDTGAWGFDPVIKTRDDLKRLRLPVIQYDQENTETNLAIAHELLGDILSVKRKGVGTISFHLMAVYTSLRGLQQVFMDMIENPEMLHEAMAFLELGSRQRIEQYEALNLLSPNNDGTYHSSGGVGYTSELPLPDAVPEHMRPSDIWASAESQEMDPVSPDMHEEFVMQYEKRLLAPFGLNGYGCCDNLTHKLDHVLKIPNIRRISIAPWADVDLCADRLAGDYIFSWKPKPTHLVGTFDEAALKKYINHTLDVTSGCVTEMILKDTHTCENEPDRFTRWSSIARDLVEKHA